MWNTIDGCFLDWPATRLHPPANWSFSSNKGIGANPEHRVRVSSGKNATRCRILSTENATIFSRVFPVEPLQN
jgi:hypothetical protein